MHVQVSFGWYSNIARIIKPFAKFHAVQGNVADGMVPEKFGWFGKNLKEFIREKYYSR